MHPLKKKPISSETSLTTSKPISSVKPPNNPFNATTEIPNSGIFTLLYGPPGEGKTTFASQFPKPLFIITNGETGIYSAKKTGVADKSIPVLELKKLYTTIPKAIGHPSWDTLISTLETFLKGNHDRRTIVIDTLSGLEALCFQHCASLKFDGDMTSRYQDSWNHYANGPRMAASIYWQNEFLNLCIDIVSKGYNIALIGHSNLRLQVNPNGIDYNLYNIELNTKILSNTNKVIHHIWFFGREQIFHTEQGTKKKKVLSNDRFIGINTTTWYTAKNWDNIQNPIECGNSPQESYANLTKQIPIN